MNNFKLYEINALLEDTLNTIYLIAEQNEGELPDDWSNRLDDIRMDREKKVLDISRYLKALNYRADIIKAEIDTLKKRYTSYSNHALSLKYYLLKNVNENERFEDGNTKISWRKSSKVIIDNAEELPNYYFKITKTPQLSAIKKDLKIGSLISGAHIEEINNIQIK